MLAFVLNASVSVFFFFLRAYVQWLGFIFLLCIDHYLIHTYYTVNKIQGRQLLVIYELRKFTLQWLANNVRTVL